MLWQTQNRNHTRRDEPHQQDSQEHEQQEFQRTRNCLKRALLQLIFTNTSKHKHINKTTSNCRKSRNTKSLWEKCYMAAHCS